MRKVLILACVVLIGIGVLLFVGGMFADGVLGLFEPVFCPAGTTLTPFRQTYSVPGETSTTVDFLCYDSEGTMVQDASGPVNLVMFGSFFLGTFLLPTLLVGHSRRKVVQAQMAARAAGGGAASIAMASPPAVARSSGDDGQTLAERLEELQHALEAGLITQPEYDRKRKEMIDKF